MFFLHLRAISAVALEDTSSIGALVNNSLARYRFEIYLLQIGVGAVLIAIGGLQIPKSYRLMIIGSLVFGGAQIFDVLVGLTTKKFHGVLRPESQSDRPILLATNPTGFTVAAIARIILGVTLSAVSYTHLTLPTKA